MVLTMMTLISVSHSFNVDAKIQKNFQTFKFYALQSPVFSFFLRKNMPFDFLFITLHFWGKFYIVSSLYALWILFIGREVRREVGREVLWEVRGEADVLLSRRLSIV